MRQRKLQRRAAADRRSADSGGGCVRLAEGRSNGQGLLEARRPEPRASDKRTVRPSDDRCCRPMSPPTLFTCTEFIRRLLRSSSS